MDKPNKLYSVVSHTHWDREWYLPFEQFRFRLVDLMDNLLEILRKDEGYRFHLDAQTIVLEDYLEIRPHKKDEIKRYVTEGRLLIGPWYVQNDFHLTSGEATVRNLIIGKSIASEYGACMESGYAADQFGLCSQLPQILNGFGYDTCIFGRGYGRGQRQFYWGGEDGSKVLCEHMTNWYNNLQRLPKEPENALALIRERAEKCQSNAKGSASLLMNGVDHLEAQEDLTEILNGVRPLLDSNETLIQDTMPEYMQRLKNEIEALGLTLECYQGEMRDRGMKVVLTGTSSSRIHLKQQNVRAQSRIEGRFEPQYAYLDALDIYDYPKDYSRYLWKTLIQNHPHDSICGCSVDAVHRHMEDRTARIFETLDDLEFRADDRYMQHLDRTRIPENGIFITCINNSPYRYDGVCTATVDILENEDTGGFYITDAKGKRIPFELLSVEKGLNKQILSPINLPGMKKINRYTVCFKARLEGMARKTLICIPENEPLTVAENKNKRTRNLENENLKVVINTNGSVNITDKRNGFTYLNALIIEDNYDGGDLYCYELGQSPVTSEVVKARVESVRQTKNVGIRRISYVLDFERDGKKLRLPVEMLLTLKAGSPRLDVEVTLDNNFGCHRTRIYMPTDLASDFNYAGQPFDVVKRKRVSDYENDEMHPNTSFVCVEDNGRGVALLNEGLYEYEHMTDERGTVALTLLRCTDRIATYMAGAGTPEGQCIGKYTLKLAVYPYSGDHVSAGVMQEADRLINPPYTAVQHKDQNKFIGGRPFVQSAAVPFNFHRPMEKPEIVLPLEARAFELTQDLPNAMILSAYKGSEDGEGQIIRLYNSTSETVDFKIKTGYKISYAYLTSLNEQILSELPVTGGKRISLTAKPKQIITLKVVK